MDIQVDGNGGLDLAQKIEELRRAMAVVALAEYVAGGDIESGKQAGDCLAMRSNSARCALFTTNSCFFGRPRRGSIPQHRIPLLYMQPIYDSED
jgi:hypothetical protein